MDYSININLIWLVACITPGLILVWRKGKGLKTKTALNYISLLIATQAILTIPIKGYDWITVTLTLLLVVQGLLVMILYRREPEDERKNQYR